MSADEFEAVKAEFEDPTAAVRLLLATDAASEGINMQECCRWVIHYDIPWSPSKLQQRNGRVSRHGQVRDVSVHYFRCDQEEDMNFLFRVAEKVEQVQARPGQRRAGLRCRHPAALPGQDDLASNRSSLFVDQQIENDPASETSWATRRPAKLPT